MAGCHDRKLIRFSAVGRYRLLSVGLEFRAAPVNIPSIHLRIWETTFRVGQNLTRWGFEGCAILSRSSICSRSHYYVGDMAEMNQLLIKFYGFRPALPRFSTHLKLAKAVKFDLVIDHFHSIDL